MWLELNMILALINSMAVIMVIAYILTRSRIYAEILDKRVTRQNKAILMIIFGAFSVYGTLSGVSVTGAIVSIRDLGPAIAGLMAGPAVGLGAGIIGGLHRLPLGGMTAIPCSLAPILAGLAGGIVYRMKKGEPIGIPGAVLLACVIEILHLGLVLLISRPFAQALQVVDQAVFPMVFANATGMGIYTFITANLTRERAVEAAKTFMESELKIARDIQMSMVPRIFPPFPERKEFELHAILEPAREVAGDFYDFFFAGERRLVFIIGDVSGKGVPASLFMALTKTLLKTKAWQGTGPDEILRSVNRELYQENDTSMFTTVFCGILDTETGDVAYGNAGHNPPVVIRRDGRTELLSGTGHLPLGVSENVTYETLTVVLGSGDTLLLYTDGVTEATSRKGDFFSESRLIRTVAETNGLPVEEILRRVMADVRVFSNGAAQADDIALLALKYSDGRQ